MQKACNAAGGTPLPNEGHLSARITAMAISHPAARPANPRFSSGPCPKPPAFKLENLAGAAIGRSHRSAIGKAKLKEAIEGTREILEIPSDYKIGIVPASDTGAVEMALWNLLGCNSIEMLAWESFGSGWVADVVSELDLPDVEVKTAEYGEIVDLESVDTDSDVVFTWNGTTSGVRVPDGNWIRPDRRGLTICDATSAAFAQHLPWDKLDVTTFSWQKVLGGEAAHGMLILSPRAVERLENYRPPRPLPKIFRLTRKGGLIEGIFEGSTINTPSMLAVEDYLQALRWSRSVGGLKGLCRRADTNLAALQNYVEKEPWIDFLATSPEARSNTSVCLRFTDDDIGDATGFEKGVTGRLEAEEVAFDIGSYRDAPPGLRIWCGATVETADLTALMPWIKWAYQTEMETGKYTS